MARNPDNLHSFYEYADEVPNAIQLHDLAPGTIPDYDLFDEKQFNKYILDVKKTVRGSFEYRNKMLPYLREHLDMNKCSFYESVSNADTTKIRIEIHHEPLGLEDFVHKFLKR